MPIGAKNVPLCFSAASKKIVITSCDVRNISMTVLTLLAAVPSFVIGRTHISLA
jgi:hypothetical protein